MNASNIETGNQFKFWRSAEPSIAKKGSRISARDFENGKKCDDEITRVCGDTAPTSSDELFQIPAIRPSTSVPSSTPAAVMEVLFQEKEKYKAARKKSLDLARCLCSVPLGSMHGRPQRQSNTCGFSINVGGKALLPSTQQQNASNNLAIGSKLHRSLDQELSEFDKSSTLRSIRLIDRTVSPIVNKAPATSRVTLLAPSEPEGNHAKTVDSGFSAFVPTQLSPSVSRFSCILHKVLRPGGAKDRSAANKQLVVSSPLLSRFETLFVPL